MVIQERVVCLSGEEGLQASKAARLDGLQVLAVLTAVIHQSLGGTIVRIQGPAREGVGPFVDRVPQEDEKIETLISKIRRDTIGSPRSVGVTTETEMERSLRPRVGSGRKRAHWACFSRVRQETVVVLGATL